jgi:hypothetical protein
MSVSIMQKIRTLIEILLVGLMGVSIYYNAKVLHAMKSADKAAIEAWTGIPSEPDSELPEKADLRTLNEVNMKISSLGSNPTARDLALAISEVDSWMIDPKSEKSAKEAIDLQVEKLRTKVVSEVQAENQKALATTNGKDANKILNEIGLLVSLYPMGDKPEIIEQARRLTDDQRKLAIKLEGMKRLRYNQWAVKRLEQALDGFHRNSSLLNPKGENKALVDSLVKYLADIDPNLLEPAVMSLYTYVLETTREAISEADRVSLARKLTAPNVQRIILEVF